MWTTPRTWTTGEIVTAAVMNTDIRDNEIEVYASCSVLAAGGTANAITVTTGGDFKYTQGRRITFVAGYTNTGATTTNVDAEGAVPLLKYDGTALTGGEIVAGRAYEAYHDTASGGRFFLLARTMGDAVAANVLASKTFSNNNGVGLTGTMPNKVGSATIFTPGTTDQTIPQGYYGGAAGDGKVLGDANLVAANLVGTIFNIAGTAKKHKTGTYIFSPYEGGYQFAIEIGWYARTINISCAAFGLSGGITSMPSGESLNYGAGALYPTRTSTGFTCYPQWNNNGNPLTLTWEAWE